jgi:hypothetical protein
MTLGVKNLRALAIPFFILNRFFFFLLILQHTLVPYHRHNGKTYIGKELLKPFNFQVGLVLGIRVKDKKRFLFVGKIASVNSINNLVRGKPFDLL